jgi:hypothetical protein
LCIAIFDFLVDFFYGARFVGGDECFPPDGYQSKGACLLINVFLGLVFFVASLQLFGAVGFSGAVFELCPLFSFNMFLTAENVNSDPILYLFQQCRRPPL